MTDQRAEKEAHLRNDLESLRIDRGAATTRAPRRRGRGKWLEAALAGLAVALLLGRAVVNRAKLVVVAQATRLEPGQSTASEILSGSGYVVTGDRYISIGVRVAGRIDHYFVEEGQTVREGDPLVQLDDRDYRAIVSRAEAALSVARANADLADAELERGRQLRRQKVVSQQELDVLENKAKVDHAVVNQSEADLAQAKVNLDYTLLRAPSDGVVLAKLKEVGEIAVPGGFAGSGDLIRLANLSDLRAEVDVNEADLNRVHMGQPAEVAPDAYPHAKYSAVVVKLYPQVDRQKGTLKVEVHILNPDDRLLPDMSVRLTFLEPLPPEQAERAAALVPLGAVRRDGEKKEFVWIVKDGRAHRVLVETSGAVGDQLRVTKGLDGGETVVVSDARGLFEGASVRSSN